MAFWFTGFFARPRIDPPTVLPAGAVWREIAVPFVGVGVRLLAQFDNKLNPTEVNRLRVEVGLNEAVDWLFISYVTWGGRIDGVYGLGATGGRAFGPIRESDQEPAEAAYLVLMGEFGVTPADALNFPPFARGFFGETS